MIAIVALLAALLIAVVVLAAVAITSRDATIQALKGEVIIRTLATREARRERDADRQTLTDTECALGLAKEILAERDVPQCEIDLLTETPLYDDDPGNERANPFLWSDPPLCRETAEHEAQVLEFRQRLQGWDGAS